MEKPERSAELHDQHDADSPFYSLVETSRELYLSDNIPKILKPTPLEFYREYVSQNRPVIITGAFDHWPALKKWSNSYLRSKLTGTEVTIDVTPNGLADAVIDHTYFVQPQKETMRFERFMDILEEPRVHNGIYYIMHQNGNLTHEFKNLWEDVGSEFEWANEAFGCSPDAKNIWIGEDRSVSSMHKDHYENLYAVIAGEKHFTLLPPSDYFYLYEQEFTAAHYHRDENGKWGLTIDEPATCTPWIPVDPDQPDLERYPLASKLRPLRVILRAGELLYLPSMWYHKVAQWGDQEARTIAINHWYDMKYDIKYNYFKFLEQVTAQQRREHLAFQATQKPVPTPSFPIFVKKSNSV